MGTFVVTRSRQLILVCLGIRIIASYNLLHVNSANIWLILSFNLLMINRMIYMHSAIRKRHSPVSLIINIYAPVLVFLDLEVAEHDHNNKGGEDDNSN